MSAEEYKLHRNEKARLHKVSRRQHVFGNILTIHPYSRFKLLWDIFIAFLVGYTALTVPFEITFVKTRDPSLALYVNLDNVDTYSYPAWMGALVIRQVLRWHNR